MKRYTATVEQMRWLVDKFGEVRLTSYTEGNKTAMFKAELGISDGEHVRPIRGYGHAHCHPVRDLFGFASNIKPGEFYVQNGKRVEPDAQLFGTNVREFKAA